MNNKISFPELVELLSKSCNASKKTCEQFLKSFFGAIEQALMDGETVKIKDLGTFKVSKVDARKSVHVATGEVIEIPEHNKIIFTPEKSLADAVNAAFGEFETIEIDDEAASAIEDVKDIDINDVVANSPIHAETIDPEENLNDEEDEEKSSISEPSTVQVEPIDDNNEEIPAVPPTETTNTSVAESQTVQPELDLIVENEDNEENNEEELAENQTNSKKVFFWGALSGFIASCALFFVISLTIGFPLVITKSNVEEEIEEEISTDSITGASSLPDSTHDVISTVEEPKPIVRTDTIKRNRFLTTMAREYYGDLRFWVYIYEENKAAIAHPDKIKQGTVVVIPDASKYDINCNDEQSIRRAEALAREIKATKK